MKNQQRLLLQTKYYQLLVKLGTVNGFFEKKAKQLNQLLTTETKDDNEEDNDQNPRKIIASI